MDNLEQKVNEELINQNEGTPDYMVSHETVKQLAGLFSQEKFNSDVVEQFNSLEGRLNALVKTLANTGLPVSHI